MSKKILQDVVKNKNQKKLEPINRKVFYSDVNPKRDDFISTKNAKKNKIFPNTLWIIAFFSVVFLFFTISSIFSTATITITPKNKDFNINKTLTANKNTESNSLSYDFVILSGEESMEVKAGEEKDYLEYAKGKVLIYNTFNSLPQKFLKDTRLEGSNGKIYKTKTEVIVPGMKNDVPGKMEVDIYANEAGDSYNSSPLDFKIFGFKGTSKYNKFYARSVGGISGGLKGVSRQVSALDKENALKKIKENLLNKLFQKAKDQIPKDFVLLKDAMYLNIDEEIETKADDVNNIVIKLKGTFNGVIFNKNKLEKELIVDALGEQDIDVYISNIEELIFSKQNKEIMAFSDIKEMTFNVSGVANIVWKINENKIKEKLLGRNKKDMVVNLAEDMSIIDSVNLIIKPVWSKKIPEKENKVKILINYPSK